MTSSQPANPIALLQQGIALHNTGRLAEAQSRYRAALALAPRHPDALHLLALCRLQQDDAIEAETLARAAIDANPRVAMFHNTLGETLRRQARLDEAEAAYRQALALDPTHLDAEANLALVAEARRDELGAAQHLLRVFHARPGEVDAGIRILRLLRGTAEQAIAQRVATELLARFGPQTREEDFCAAAAAASTFLCRHEALAVAERWQQFYPESSMARLWRAIVLAEMHREAEAIPIFEQLLQQGVSSVGAMLKLAVALQRSGRSREAMAYLDSCLAVAPDDAHARGQRALLLIEEGSGEEGLAELRALVAAAPEEAGRLYDLALSLLLLGDFTAGWEAYEARAGIPDCDAWVFKRARPMPRWQGEIVAGKRLLVIAEQGAGDFVQFARFLPRLIAQGMALFIETPASSRDLVALAVPQASVLVRGDALPEADAWCSLISLPFLLGSLDDFAVPLPYLHPDPAAVEAWRARLRAAGATRAVGVCWAGSQRHAGDPWRSCAPSLLAALGDLEGVHFVCLQKDRRDEGLPVLPNWLDWSEELGSFADTAALTAALDAVVTVDTSVAHIAGALGVPTAVLVTRMPDWRWQLERSDSPWYPSVHIARQRRYGHWPDALAKARDWLAARFGLAAPSLAESGETTEDASRAAYALVETRHGRMLANRNDLYVGRSLIDYGEFSEEEVAFMTRFVGPGSVVVDAGANVGAVTLPLARKVGPAGRVWAFEPQRLVFQLLCANLALNEVFNVEARQMAVGAAPGTIEVPDINPLVIANFGGLEAGRGNGEAPMTTIDALGLERCDFIKADVEGMEIELLKGAADTLARFRPVLYLENDRREKSPNLIGHLQAAGYDLWWHAPPLYSPQNFRQQSMNVFARIVSVNVLAVPKERGHVCDLRPVRGADDWTWG